jgi:hypothetical protein
MNIMDLISFSRMTQNVGIKSSAHLRWLLLLLRASFPERRPQSAGVNKLHDPSSVHILSGSLATPLNSTSESSGVQLQMMRNHFPAACSCCALFIQN